MCNSFEALAERPYLKKPTAFAPELDQIVVDDELQQFRWHCLEARCRGPCIPCHNESAADDLLTRELMPGELGLNEGLQVEDGGQHAAAALHW